MPIPKVVGQWNKVGLNRVTRRVAPWMPGFGVVVHRGRRSGKAYETPVNVSSRPRVSSPQPPAARTFLTQSLSAPYVSAMRTPSEVGKTFTGVR